MDLYNRNQSGAPSLLTHCADPSGSSVQKGAEAEAIALELEMKSKFVSVCDIKARLLGHWVKIYFIILVLSIILAMPI